jgi:hypothetical protein
MQRERENCRTCTEQAKKTPTKEYSATKYHTRNETQSITPTHYFYLKIALLFF